MHSATASSNERPQARRQPLFEQRTLETDSSAKAALALLNVVAARDIETALH